jgi:hypothetical protein
MYFFDDVQICSMSVFMFFSWKPNQLYHIATIVNVITKFCLWLLKHGKNDDQPVDLGLIRQTNCELLQAKHRPTAAILQQLPAQPLQTAPLLVCNKHLEPLKLIGRSWAPSTCCADRNGVWQSMTQGPSPCNFFGPFGEFLLTQTCRQREVWRDDNLNGDEPWVYGTIITLSDLPTQGGSAPEEFQKN